MTHKSIDPVFPEVSELINLAVRLKNSVVAAEKSDGQIGIRAAIYARVASLNQKSNHGINEQVACCRKHAKQRGWIVHYVFIDKGESGRTLDRPGFQSMLEKAKSGCFDVIVVHQLDRLSRSLMDLVNTVKILNEHRVTICSVTEYPTKTRLSDDPILNL